jgi:hypothetical protein
MDRATYERVYGKGTALFELAWFQKELPRESERGQVLVIAAFIEDVIANILGAILPEQKSTEFLLGPNGPISSLAAKSALACSLRAINADQYRNIDQIRKIRNRFAHAVECSFQDPEVQKLSDRLNYGLSNLDSNPATRPIGLQRFHLSASGLLLVLHDVPEKLKSLRQ